MRRPDPGAVLRELARTLDIPATLSRFPGLSAADLSRLLEQAAGPAPLDLFPPDRPVRQPHARAVLHVDGGARGNPGPAGVGAVLEFSGQAPAGRGEYIGEATNNVAEYRALLLGLTLAREAGARRVAVHSDSELLVRQMTGVYKVKNHDLRALHDQAQKAAGSFDSVSYTHIPREKNARADLLVNRAIDARGRVEL